MAAVPYDIRRGVYFASCQPCLGIFADRRAIGKDPLSHPLVPLDVPHKSGLVPALSHLASRSVTLVPCSQPAHAWRMFSVDETTAAAIRQAYESGELPAIVELQQHFPGITDNESARRCVRAIAGWKPLPPLAVG
jgi:hypothetical protein